MSDGLSPYEIERRRRDADETENLLRRGIERTSKIPAEVLTIPNFAHGISESGPGTVLHVFTPNGRQYDLPLTPGSRKALIDGLVREEERVQHGESDGSSSGLIVPDDRRED